MRNEAKRLMRQLRILGATVPVVVASLLLVTSVKGMAASPQEELVEKARQTVISFMFNEELGWFHQNVKHAKALLIVPSFTEVAFGVGGSHGRGVLLVRQPRTGEWSQPAFYEIETVSIGLKVGAQVTEGALLVMSKKGVNHFLKPLFKVDGTDLKMTALSAQKTKGVTTAPKGDLITFTISKGVLAGASLRDAEIAVDELGNKAYYGRDVSPKEILIQGKVSNPASLPLRVTLKDFAQ